jgi:hypothetical protein
VEKIVEKRLAKRRKARPALGLTLCLKIKQSGAALGSGAYPVMRITARATHPQT